MVARYPQKLEEFENGRILMDALQRAGGNLTPLVDSFCMK